jgi:hypothetical protein
MFMVYDSGDGSPISFQEEQPQSGAWSAIPASAMQDPPLCYWDATAKAWADGDGGYRWDANLPGFTYAFGNRQTAYYERIDQARADAVARAYPDAATVALTERLGLEARAYAGDAAPSLVNYPMINQLKTVNGLTEAEAVAEARDQFLFWQAAMGAIWARWRKARTDIADATTIAELDAAISIDWDAVITNATGDLTDWPESYLRGASGGGATSWAGITGKPSTFPPEAHSHAGIYEAAGVASAAMTAHLGDADPHPQYTTAAELTAAIAGVAAAAKGVHAKEVILSTGAYISQAVNGLALSTAASAANRFYAFPFIPAQTITINELAVEVTTLKAGSAHLGIYADSAGSPGAKIIGSTTAVDTGTTGAKAVAISNTTLTAGTIYWLVVWTSSAATFRSVAQGALAVIGLTSTLNAQYTSRLATSTFGALPANAPATTLTAGAVPQLLMKIA